MREKKRQSKDGMRHWKAEKKLSENRETITMDMSIFILVLFKVAMII